MAGNSRARHNQLQVDYFDQRAELFQQTIPEDVQKRTQQIITSANIVPGSSILDVGTGTGVLISYFLSAGVQEASIVGCDLSTRMLEVSRKKFPNSFFWQGDVLDFSINQLPAEQRQRISSFNFIFINACFGNMLDQKEVLRRLLSVLSNNGKIVISHPAPEFVANLHDSDPDLVPHLLPTREQLLQWCAELGFGLNHFQSSDLLYIAILTKP